MLFIVIDESGDLGFNLAKKGTSKNFVITAMVFHNREAQKRIEKAVLHTMRRKINVRRKRRDKKINELKGSWTSLTVKKYFWKKIKVASFELYAVVLEKDEDYPNFTTSQQERLYRRMTRMLVDMIPVEKEKTVIHLEVDAGRKHRDEFDNEIMLYVDGQIFPTVNRFIRHMLSEESKLIQATDMFCWAIGQKHRAGKREWYDMFKHRIKDKRVIRVGKKEAR